MCQRPFRRQFASKFAESQLHDWQDKLALAQELTRRAENFLEKSIPAQLKDFEQRLVNVKEKHEGIKTRYEEQVKALKEEVAAKNGVGALRPLCVCARWDGLAKPL
jgi:hypothetical protein